jgi:phosphoserine phosphatase
LNQFEIPESDLKKLLKKNRARISKNIQEIIKDSYSGQKILLAMDFDECAPYQHFSEMIIRHYWNRGVIDQDCLGDNSVIGIARLFNCYVGLSKEEFEHTLKRLSKQLEWKEGFTEIFKKILQKKSIFPIFVSSGITEAVRYALRTIGFESVNVLADDLGYREGVIYGPYTIVSDVLKGEIVKEIVQLKKFDRVVTLGHSGGDVELIKSGTEGDRISFRDKEEAMLVADIVIDTWYELEDILGLKS